MTENFDPEKIAGIIGYSTNSPPLGGHIKADIADFIVREITNSGEMLSTHEKERVEIPFNSKRDRATLFTLIKKKMDTILASKIIAEYLQISQSHVKWAGIKDHTAITAQKFTVRGNVIKKLKKFSHDRITLTNIRPAREEMDLGKLWGNHFTINLRKINTPFEEIAEILHKWRYTINETGFPNFFGTQRFGQHRPNSHKVGKHVFKMDYEKACNEFLFKVYPREYPESQEFRRKLAESRDYVNILNEFPKGLHYEKMIIHQLAHGPTDFKKAIQALPKPLLN
jgi:tRNA pseudouridine13 synthase